MYLYIYVYKIEYRNVFIYLFIIHYIILKVKTAPWKMLPGGKYCP